MRLGQGIPIDRRKGHKPEVDDLPDPEVALQAKGYEGLRLICCLTKPGAV